jgi:O-antigen/teichoic acid export membrane protein
MSIATTAVGHPPTFSAHLGATARAIAGRQGGALLLVGAVVALPAVAAAGVVTDFTWAYVGMLTLTSLLGLGVEQLAMIVVAQRATGSPTSAVRPLIVLRLVTAPVVAVALWLLLAFVHVRLSFAAAAFTVLWVVAAQVLVVATAGLRAVGNMRPEPVVTAIARGAQGALLVGLGTTGASATVLVGALAAVEMLAALGLMRALGSRWWRREADEEPWRSRFGGWRRAGAFAGIETVGLFYLRADLLLVGHLLGAAAGATYGVLYRVVDGASGAAGTASLCLFAAAASARDGGDRRDGVRVRSLAVMPLLAAAFAAVAVVGAGPLGSAIPRIGGEVDTLRLLIAATPLLVWNRLELHVRAASGRHAGVLRVGAAAFVVNVGLCVWLVGSHGLIGAAIALLATESLQTVMLVGGAARGEREIARSTAARAAGAAALLLSLAGVLA